MAIPGLLAERRRVLLALGTLGVLAIAAVSGALLGKLPMKNGSLFLWFWGILATGTALIRWRSKWLVALFGLSTGAFLLELGAFLFLLSPVGRAREYHYQVSTPYTKPDSLLGHKNKSNVRASESKWFGDEDYVYRNAVYSTDDKGRRTCCSLDSEKQPPLKHALFLGCSFTFGSGVRGEETLPSAFQRVSGGEYRCYNYGSNGYGTGQVYLQLTQAHLFDDVLEPDGIAVYSFIADHLNRSTPYLVRRIRHFAADARLFRLSAKGILEGPFHCADLPVVRSAVGIFVIAETLSPTWRMINEVSPVTSACDIPLLSQEDALRVIEALVVAAQDQYHARFRGRFCVIMWPRVVHYSPPMQMFLKRLEQHGISVLPCPDMPTPSAGQIHPRDQHPSAREYEWVARTLLDFLEAD